MSPEVAYFLFLVILLLVALLFAAYHYSQHQTHQFEEWLRIRIQAEMGLNWYATWRHLSLEQLWLQFTYDGAYECMTCGPGRHCPRQPDSPKS